jgi:hypothetical protein
MKNAALEELSAKLKLERENRKLSAEKVSNAIRFDDTYIVAMESGELEALPQGYARMFFRSYLKYLGLDSAENLELLAQALDSPLPKKSPLESDTVTAKKSESRAPSEAVKHITWLPIVFVLALLIYFSVDYFNSKSIDEEPVKELSLQDSKALIDTVTVDSTKLIKHYKEDSLRLFIAAKAPVFVVAKLDSLHDYKKRLVANQKDTIRASQHINLYVSEGSHLALSFQDSTIEALSAPNLRINYMIFTKAGIGARGLSRKKEKNVKDSLSSN